MNRSSDRYSSYAIDILFIFIFYILLFNIIYILFIYYLYIIYILFIYYLYIIYILFIYYLYIIYILFIYYLYIILYVTYIIFICYLFAYKYYLLFVIYYLLFVDSYILFVIWYFLFDFCCSFRTLVRAHRKRRSTAGHGSFYVIFASVRRVSRHHGVGWGGAVITFLWIWSRCTTPRIGVGRGSDDVPLNLITLLMLRHALGWGGVGWGQWRRSFGLNYVIDVTPRIGVGWGGTGLHALAFYRKERMSRIGCEPKKIGDLSQDKDWLKVWRKTEIKNKCSINFYWQPWVHEIFKLDSTIKSAHKIFIYTYIYICLYLYIYI